MRGHLPSNDAASKQIWLTPRNITAEQPTATPGFEAAINLQPQTLTPAGSAAVGLHIDPARKHRRLNGLVDRSFSLQIASEAALVAVTQSSQPPQFPGRFFGEKTSDLLSCEHGMT